MRVGLNERTGQLLTGWAHCQQCIRRCLRTRFRTREMRYHLGSEVPASDLGDLAAATGVTIVSGVEAGRGVGADVLGHPFEAVLWLAGHLATLGRRIEAGETVLTGSLVETRWLQAGDTARIAIDGLGEVALRAEA